VSRFAPGRKIYRLADRSAAAARLAHSRRAVLNPSAGRANFPGTSAANWHLRLQEFVALENLPVGGTAVGVPNIAVAARGKYFCSTPVEIGLRFAPRSSSGKWAHKCAGDQHGSAHRFSVGWLLLSAVQDT